MRLRMMTAGESHGPAMVSVLDGFPAGLKISVGFINHELQRRQKGFGSGARMKIEKDRARILSGVMGGVTNGAPIAIVIENLDHKKWQNREIESFTVPRPGHADLTGTIKFGFNDLRYALERASARETASRVAIGALCKMLLSEFGITVGGYVGSLGEIVTDYEHIPIEERLRLAEENELRCPDVDKIEAMREIIQKTMQSKDTLGGVIEVLALNVPPGLGSYTQWDRRLDARLGAAFLSVQAVKGVEIGPAFANTLLPGTQVQDGIRLKGGKLVRDGNRAGGIEGGISNGEPILLRAAMKPIATTLTPQKSVDLATGIEVETKYERSDFCPVPRAVPILESMMAFVLADELIEKLGGDSLAEMKASFSRLSHARLKDITIEGNPKIFWQGGE